MLLLGVDFETTGLVVGELDVIEVGAVLWDTDRRAPVLMLNELVKAKAVPKEITDLTGITIDDLNLYGLYWDDVAPRLLAMAGKAEAIVAHNGTEFDRPIWNRFLVPFNKWIDTSVDVPYPASITTRKLTHLAAEHGILNPFPHRAMTDVLTMLSILSKYDAQAVLALSQVPTVKVVAHVNFEDKELAKARGYRWEAERKRWVKNIKENQLDAERTQAGFSVKVATR